MSNSAAVRAVREPTEWKGVPGYDSYEVSDTGLVRSYKNSKPRILGGATSPTGYIAYKLIGEEKSDFRHVYAQEIVLELWVGERPTNMWAGHIDKDNGNNAIENLKWMTPFEACQGRDVLVGEDRSQAKLTEKDVRNVRLKRKAGVTYQTLAEEYGLAKNTLWRLCVGRTWKHVSMEGLDVK